LPTSPTERKEIRNFYDLLSDYLGGISYPGCMDVVYVIATSVEGTRAALGVATAWARGHSGNVVLLVRRGDGGAQCLESTLRGMADVCTPRPHVLSCVCDRALDLLQMIQPSGVVVMGGGTRWGWPTAEERLAHALIGAGHRVMFAYLPRSPLRAGNGSRATGPAPDRDR